MKLTLLSSLLLMIFLSCKEKNMETLPDQSEEGFYYMVVEIPAGTNKKYEFDTESMTFEIDQKDGKDRIISYLPYFGNYGFIPSTLSDKSKGGDGDPLDMILLAESIVQGTLVETIPLATVKLKDNQEEDFKIISVPADDNLNILHVKTSEELQSKHPSVIPIIEIWLKNYDSDSLVILGWLNQSETIEYIRKNINTSNELTN
jgi:inorganic pyrophosphatase